MPGDPIRGNGTRAGRVVSRGIGNTRRPAAGLTTLPPRPVGVICAEHLEANAELAAELARLLAHAGIVVRRG